MTSESTDAEPVDLVGDIRDVLMLPDELLLVVGACALESHLPTIFRARASCKRLQDVLAQLCTTTEGSRRLQWVDELSLKVEITNLGSTVRSPPSGSSWACGGLLPPGSWQWSITLDSTMVNETGQFIGVCNESGTVGFGFHPFSGNMWTAARGSDNDISYGGAATTQSDAMFTRAFALGGHLQQILLPEDGMEEDQDAMSGWHTNIREGARIGVILAEDEPLPGKPQRHWLGFHVNGGPLRYAGSLLGSFRVRPWVYMSSSYLDQKREQLTSSSYLIVDTTHAEECRDAWRVFSFANGWVGYGAGDESEGDESEGESQGESEGGSEDEPEGES